MIRSFRKRNPSFSVGGFRGAKVVVGVVFVVVVVLCEVVVKCTLG